MVIFSEVPDVVLSSGKFWSRMAEIKMLRQP